MADELKMLNISKIEPNPFQPRETFKHEPLRELADSIDEIGVLQPVLVRPHGNKYQIIAGERRWRACLDAGKKEIPALIRDMNDGELQVASLIENIHREDLEPMEKAKALMELGKTLNLFDRVGAYAKPEKEVIEVLHRKTKIGGRTIESLLDLLDLPKSIQKEVRSPGAGTKESVITIDKALRIGRMTDKEDQKKVLEKVKEEEISDKEVRKLVKVVEEAPEVLKRELFKKKPEITIDQAERILEKVEIAKEHKKVEPEKFAKATIEEYKEINKESKKEEARMLKVGDKIAKGEMEARGFLKESTPVQKKALAKMVSMVDDAWWAFDVTVIESMDARMKNEAITLIKKLEKTCHERLVRLGVYDK